MPHRSSSDMSNSKFSAASAPRRGMPSEQTTTTPVPPEDELSLFDPPPDVIYLPASCSSPTSPPPDHTAGGSKHITATVKMPSELHCKAATGEGLPSPAILGARLSGTGGSKRGNKQLATRGKAAKKRGRSPILVPSSPSTMETRSKTLPVGEGSKSGVPPVEKGSKPSACTVATACRGNESVHVSKSGFPPESKPPSFSDSPAAPSLPPNSADLVQAPTLNVPLEGAASTPFCSRNPKFDSWLRRQPIPASLEELVRLFVSSRQMHSSETVLDVYESIGAISPPKWHRPGGYDI